MNISESDEVIFDKNSGYFNEGKIYKFEQVLKTTHNSSDIKSFSEGFRCRVIKSDGTWVKGKISISYRLKFEEVLPEPLTTPPPSEHENTPPEESEYDWPPKENY
jgi:hypothetical protein